MVAKGQTSDLYVLHCLNTQNNNAMNKVRDTVYLLIFIIGALVSFGCTVNVEHQEAASAEEQQEEVVLKEKALKGYGGERTDFQPIRDKMP